MSRRKQANPKPIKDAIENKMILCASTNTNIISTNEIEHPQSKNNIQETLKRELEKSDEINENKKVKKNENNNNSLDSSSSLNSSSSSSSNIYNQNDNNDIDVENFSDSEDTKTKTDDNSIHSSNGSYVDETSVDDDDDDDNSPSSFKENNINSTQWSYQSPLGSPSSLSASYTPVTSPSLHKSVSSIETINSGPKSKIDDDALKKKQNQLNDNNKDSTSIEVRKQSHNDKMNQQHEQQQRSTPILMNGKKYYPLLFNCSDCGVRYSDKGALLTHQQNYCSKRTTKETKIASNETDKSSLDHNNLIINGKNSCLQLTDLKVEENDNHYENIELTNNNNDIKSTNEKILNTDEHLSLNLVKTEIYQCSYCTFTTDKKCAINKHSRVHLAQKRKAMEELNNSNKDDPNDGPKNNFNDIYSSKRPFIKIKDKKSNVYDNQGENFSSRTVSNSNHNQTYCNECEIQFSSLKTFMHHKTHYCQKYKTIEAVLPQTSVTPTSLNNSKSTKFDFKSNNSEESSEEANADKKRLEEKIDDFKIQQRIEQNKILLDEQNNQNKNRIVLSQAIGIQNNPAASCKHTLNKQRIEDNQEMFKSTTTNKLSVTNNLNIQKNTPLVHQTNRAPGEVVYVPVYIPNSNSKVNSLTSSSISSYRVPFPLQQPSIEFIYSSQKNRPLNLNSNSLSNIQSSSSAPLDLRLNLNEIKHHSIIESRNSINNSPLDLSCKSKEIAAKSFIDQHKIKQAVPISCEQCNSCFQNNQVLTLHKLNECPRVLLNNYESRLNKLPYNNVAHKGINSNELTTTQETFICKTCNKSFSNFKIYKLHNCDLKSTEEIKVYFQCKLCLNQPTFKHQDDYINHLNTVHQNETVMVKQASPVPSISPLSSVPISSLKKIYICKTCGYRGNTLRGVKQHGKLHLIQMEPFDILEAGLDEFDKITIFRNVDEKELKFSKNTELTDELKQIKNENNDEKNRHQNTIQGDSDESSDGFYYQTYCTTCKIQFQQEHSFNAHKKFYCKDSNHTQLSSLKM